MYTSFGQEPWTIDKIIKPDSILVGEFNRMIEIDFVTFNISSIQPDTVLNPWKPSFFLAQYNNNWEPIMNVKSKGTTQRNFDYNDSIFRKVLDHLSDINMPLTEQEKNNLRNDGKFTDDQIEYFSNNNLDYNFYIPDVIYSRDAIAIDTVNYINSANLTTCNAWTGDYSYINNIKQTKEK